MTPVASSAIAALGYAARDRTLFVRFHSEETYAYLDVPEATWLAFQAAPSKGRFFQEEIDPAFRYVRLD